MERYNQIKKKALDTRERKKFIKKASEKFNEVYKVYWELLNAYTISDARKYARGISIGISNMSKQEKAQYCKWSCDSGLLLTSEIINAIEAVDITEDNLGNFIRQILESRCMK